MAQNFFIFILRSFLLACALFIFSFSARAVTLEEYRENVSYLNSNLDLLIYPDEDLSEAEAIAFEKQFISELPQMLPARGKIEWQNLTYETNNQAIHDALGRFAKLPRDSVKRNTILNEISERLSALELKLDETLHAAASARSKDEDKRKLAEILRREEYQKPKEEEESFIQSLYRQFMEWLEKMFPRPKVSETSTSGFQSLSFVLQMLLYAVILGAIGFLIYRFAPLFTKRFSRGGKEKKDERVILGEKLAADANAQILFAEAEALAREGNLRGAIRKGYIALLCELSDRKVIGLSRHKTNRDYLRDVRKKSDLYENMNGLTQNFERHWYGFEDAAETDWQEFREGYRKIVGS